MPTFGQDFLKGFYGNNSLRDYQHASRTFTTNAYELKPRFKFLFHVSFTLNIQEIPALRGAFSNDDITQLSYVVKTADLPKYTIENETLKTEVFIERKESGEEEKNGFQNNALKKAYSQVSQLWNRDENEQALAKAKSRQVEFREAISLT